MASHNNVSPFSLSFTSLFKDDSLATVNPVSLAIMEELLARLQESDILEQIERVLNSGTTISGSGLS